MTNLVYLILYCLYLVHMVVYTLSNRSAKVQKVFGFASGNGEKKDKNQQNTWKLLKIFVPLQSQDVVRGR